MPGRRPLTIAPLFLALCCSSLLPAQDAGKQVDTTAKRDPEAKRDTGTKRDTETKRDTDTKRDTVEQQDARKKSDAPEGDAAAKPEKATQPEKADKPRDKPPVLPPEREKATRDFAEKQHPELARLLTQLKKTAPGEYAAAITELDRARERLEKVQERQPERYDAELQEWTITSRVRLILARMAMNDDPLLDEELATAVRQRQDLRRNLLTTERDRISRRLEKVESLRKELQRDDAVKREVASLKKGATAAQTRVKSKVKATRPSAEAAAKPAAKSESPTP